MVCEDEFLCVGLAKDEFGIESVCCEKIGNKREMEQAKLGRIGAGSEEGVRGEHAYGIEAEMLQV